MVRPARFRALCLALPEVEERPHFDRTAFRTPARIFASLGAKGEEANVLVPLELQDMLVASLPAAFERIDNAWGARGWTRMNLPHVDEATCREVLREAHALATAAPKSTRSSARTKAKSMARTASNRASKATAKTKKARAATANTKTRPRAKVKAKRGRGR